MPRTKPEGIPPRAGISDRHRIGYRTARSGGKTHSGGVGVVPDAKISPAACSVLRHNAEMNLLRVLALGVCASALSGCGGSHDAQGCPPDQIITGVKVDYSGFASNTKLTTQVCVKNQCYVSATATADSETQVSVGRAPGVPGGSRVISVTVRDLNDRVVARDDAVVVRPLSEGDQCPAKLYDAAVQVSPNHIAATTRT